MKIVPNQDFKHDTESYQKGEEYEVDEDLGEYFFAAGWVGDGESATGVHSLDIQDMELGHSSEVN